MFDLQARFVRFARARRLIRAEEHVLVALSGGVDSVVLLDLLRASSKALACRLSAAHFDHAMRPDSAADAEWVAGLCAAWGVPLLAARSARPLSGETDARAARYAFLQDAMASSGATRVALAHHADDQVETVLFRLLRGTGMRGLAGMPMRRGRYIRPLLRFTKRELLEYAAERGLSYREDPSNELSMYARNRIRRTVIPVLETVQPNAPRSVLRLAQHAARAERAARYTLNQLAAEITLAADENSLEIARDRLLDLPEVLRADLLRHLLRRFGVVPGRARTKDLVAFSEHADSGSSVSVGRSTRIERSFDRLRFVKSDRPPGPARSVPIEGEHGSAVLTLCGRAHAVQWEAGPARAGTQVFDAAILSSGLELRGWRPGDRIRLPYGTKKLKKLLAERRVAVSERGCIPLLSDSAGRVFWVVGHTRSVDALPGDTGFVLNITVQNAESR